MNMICCTDRYWSEDYRSSYQRCSIIKGVLKKFAKFTGKYLCKSLFFNKETLTQVFSCEFCETPFFTEHLWMTTSCIKN